jgi:hypothetical protein
MPINFLGEPIHTKSGKNRMVKFITGLESGGQPLPIEYSLTNIAESMAESGMGAKLLEIVGLLRDVPSPGIRRLALEALAPVVYIDPSLSYEVFTEGLVSHVPDIREVTHDFLVEQVVRNKQLSIYTGLFGADRMRDLVAMHNSAYEKAA